MTAFTSPSSSVSRTCSAIKILGRLTPTTAKTGNACFSLNTGIDTGPTLISAAFRLHAAISCRVFHQLPKTRKAAADKPKTAIPTTIPIFTLMVSPDWTGSNRTKAGSTKPTTITEATRVGITRSTNTTRAQVSGLSLWQTDSSTRHALVSAVAVSKPTASKNVNNNEVPIRKYIEFLLALHRSFLFFYKAFELIEQFAVFCTDRVDNARKHRSKRFRRAVEQTCNNIAKNADLHFFMRDSG